MKKITGIIVVSLIIIVTILGIFFVKKYQMPPGNGYIMPGLEQEYRDGLPKCMGISVHLKDNGHCFDCSTSYLCVGVLIK